MSWAAIANVGRLGCDTAPLIYLMEGHPTFGPPMIEVARRVDDGGLHLVCSSLTLTEVLVHPLKAGRQDLADAYRRLLTRHAHVSLVDIGPAIAERAAVLRARYSLRTPDALQVASAIESGCEAFLTNDDGLQRVTEISVVLVSSLEPVGSAR